MLGKPLHVLPGLSSKVSVLRLENQSSMVALSVMFLLQFHRRRVYFLIAFYCSSCGSILAQGMAASVYTKTMADVFVNMHSSTVVEFMRGLWCFVKVSF